MKNYEFVVWLEGYLELCPDDDLDVRKVRVIKNHLNLVNEISGLGELNQKINTLVTQHLETPNAEDMRNLHGNLKQKIDSFLQETFPDSSLDPCIPEEESPLSKLLIDIDAEKRLLMNPEPG